MLFIVGGGMVGNGFARGLDGLLHDPERVAPVAAGDHLADVIHRQFGGNLPGAMPADPVGKHGEERGGGVIRAEMM